MKHQQTDEMVGVAGKRLVRLNVEDLRVDERYQRPLNRRRAASMAHDSMWDPRVASPPLVNARDGAFFIVDGQHTCEGYKCRGIAEIDVWLIDPPVSAREEAALFDKANSGRAPVKCFNTFQARLTSEDATAKAVTRILDSLRIQHVGGGTKSAEGRRARAVGCTTALELTYSNIGERLRDVLSTIGDAFGHTHDSWQSEVVLAVARCIAAFPSIDLRRLTERLREQHDTARDLIRSAMEARRFFTDSQRDLVIARLILQDYNRKLRGENKLDDSELSRRGVWQGKRRA